MFGLGTNMHIFSLIIANFIKDKSATMQNMVLLTQRQPRKTTNGFSKVFIILYEQ